MKSENVVITGMGAVTPVGIGVDEYWQSLLSSRSGAALRDDFADTGWPMRFYAPVVGFDGSRYVNPRKAIKVMCIPIQFGYAASVMAFQQAGLNRDTVDPDRVGTVFGADTFFADPRETTLVFHHCIDGGRYVHERWGHFAMRDIEPLWMLKYLPNMVTSHISIACDARGPSNSICQAEVSSLLALIEGSELIRRGHCDVVIAGGTGSQIAVTGLLFRGQQGMSRRFNRPEQASRPFDRDRDGVLYGEGAGAVVLESRQHAERRGARILASLSGWSRGYSKCRQSLHDDLCFHIKNCLDSSTDSDGQISHVNAHGASCPENDRHEAQAIRAVLGNVPVIAVKSNHGQLGPGGPIVELIASIKALEANTLPAVLNYKTADPQCPVNVVRETIAAPGSRAAKIAFSSTGQIATVLVSRNAMER
jgi:3-oxoacyl-[acyl-carrier-protein] synthase II